MDQPGLATAADALSTAGPTYLHGRILDQRTAEPVPEFTVRIVRAPDDVEENVITDAEGRFSTHTLHAPGAFEFLWTDPSADDSRESASIEVHDSSEIEFRVKVGPTYHLVLRSPLPIPTADLRAMLGAEAERESLGGSSAWLTPMRGDAAPWVRFHPDEVNGSGALGPWRLDVATEAGVWRGHAQVRSIVGIYPEPVVLELTAHASLSGVVRDEQGRAVESVHVRLKHPDGEVAAEEWHPNEGRYRLRGIRPGRWIVEVDSYEHQTQTTPLELPAGRETVHDATLVSLVPAGAVRGIVTSATGTWTKVPAEVALWGHEGSKSNRRSKVVWTKREERWVHEFVFDDVPAGTYTVNWVSRACPFDVFPAPVQIVSVPADGVEFRILDDVSTAPLVFRARGTSNGELLPRFDVYWLPPGGWAGWKRGVAPDEVVIESWPLHKELSWVLRTPSGALVSGDSSAFVHNGKQLVVDVTIDDGYGVQFFVEDKTGEELPGIRFVFDGTQVSTSGARGRMPVAFARRPMKIEVDTPGWKIVGGSVDPLTSDFDDTHWWGLSIVLDRKSH